MPHGFERYLSDAERFISPDDFVIALFRLAMFDLRRVQL
jgi:hypothetical protein